MEQRGNKPTPATVTTVEEIGGKGGSLHLQTRSKEPKSDGRDIEVDIIFGPGDDVPLELYSQLKKS